MFKALYQAYINFFYQHSHRGVAVFILYWWVNKIANNYGISVTGRLMDIEICLYYWTFFYTMGAFAELFVESIAEEK